MLNAQLTLAFMVFLLGVKHGFEPDHLAVIDGMTRCISSQSTIARYTGFLFSLGHGLVVVLIALLVGVESQHWRIPDWFNGLGIWISIVSLYLLGIFNFYALFNKKHCEVAKFSGPKSFIFYKLLRFDNAKASFLGPVILGVLFSLSFDTVSQTVAFSLSAHTLAGWLFPAMLGTTFMLGMMTIDGLNGYLVARIIGRADKQSQFVSRGLGILIGSISLIMGSYYLLTYFYAGSI